MSIDKGIIPFCMKYCDTDMISGNICECEMVKDIKALVEKSVEEERKQNIELLRYVKSKQGKEQHWFDVGEEAGYKRGKRGVEEYKAKVDIDLSITILKEYLKKEVLAPNGKADIKEALRLLELSQKDKGVEK